MNSYIKASIKNKVNGLFKGNAIIIKKSDNNVFLVAPEVQGLNIPGEHLSEVGDGITVASERSLIIRRLSRAERSDSFYTIALQAVCDGLLGDYTLEIDSNVTVIDEIFAIQLDSIFLVEERQRGITGGLLIKQGYTQDSIYSGYSGYHHNQTHSRFNRPLTADKPWRIGVELEVYAVSREKYEKIINARTNWFQCERDGSLNEGNYPIEIKTIPLKACDAKSVDFWKEPLDMLRSLARSKGFRSTGLHVHIGKEILGDSPEECKKTLDKLCWFYSYLIEEDEEAHAKNVIICGREEGYHAVKVKEPLADFAKKVGFKAVQQSEPAFFEMANAVKSKVSEQRGDINLYNLNGYGTIEFRKGDGRISKTRMAALVTWWEQMVLYCRYTPAKDLDFNDFFTKICSEYPAVNYYFMKDEEA